MKSKLKMIRKLKRLKKSEKSKEEIKKNADQACLCLLELMMLEATVKTISNTEFNYEFQTKW